MPWLPGRLEFLMLNPSRRVSLSKKIFFFMFLFVAVVAAGGLFLVTWEIPPPTTQVEKTIPDERLPK